MMFRGSILRRLYRFTWRYKMTPPGKLLTAIIGVASIGTVTIEVPIYQVCCAFLGLIFAAELAGAIMRPRLAVQPRWPQTLTVGQEATIPVRVTNKTWRPALDVMLTLLDRPRRLRHTNGDVVLGRLDRNRSHDIPLRVRPTGRGKLRLPSVDAHSTFPFNLVRIPGGQSDARDLLVRPSFPTLRLQSLPMGAYAELGDYNPNGQSGESNEYLGNRDYTPGEPVRRLDVRAWARLGHPVIREYQDEQGSRFGLLIDTRLPRRRRAEASRRMEAAISLGAGISAALLSGGYDVGLLATGTDLYQFDRAQPQRLETILDLLGEIEPTDFCSLDRMKNDLIDETEQLAGLFVVLADWDDRRERFLQSIDDAGIALRTFLVTDRRSERRLPDAAINLETIDATAILSEQIDQL